jgi:hypothetical protein
MPTALSSLQEDYPIAEAEPPTTEEVLAKYPPIEVAKADSEPEAAQ